MSLLSSLTRRVACRVNDTMPLYGYQSKPSFLLQFRSLAISTRHMSSKASGPRKVTPTTRAQVQKMRDRFQSSPADGEPDAEQTWDSLWKEGVTPWDLGGPTPVLRSELNFQLKTNEWTFESAFIPGCGSGYDLMALKTLLDEQSTGTAIDRKIRGRVVGLEISSTSLDRAREVISSSLANDTKTNVSALPCTTLELFRGDFFAHPSQWDPVFTTTLQNENLTTGTQPAYGSERHTFDLIVDYLFFCAIPPAMRSEWGQQMARLLRPNGKLLTLIFPFHDQGPGALHTSNSKVTGPPYHVSLRDYQQALNVHGLYLETPLPYSNTDTVPQRHGQEVIGWWSFSNDDGRDNRRRMLSTLNEDRALSRVLSTHQEAYRKNEN